MAKRSNSNLHGIVRVDTLADEEVVEYTNIEQSVVRVRSKYPARIKHIGQVTGQQYVWNSPGDVIEVSARDWDSMKAKRVGKTPCCGASGNENFMFELE